MKSYCHNCKKQTTYYEKQEFCKTLNKEEQTYKQYCINCWIVEQQDRLEVLQDSYVDKLNSARNPAQVISIRDALIRLVNVVNYAVWLAWFFEITEEANRVLKKFQDKNKKDVKK
jgi:hypothetical protein